MDALRLINRLSMEVAVYGNHEVLVDGKPIITIVEDIKMDPVSAGEAKSTRVFHLVKGK